MSVLILPLCAAIAVVITVMLVLEVLRIRSGFRNVKERERRIRDRETETYQKENEEIGCAQAERIANAVAPIQQVERLTVRQKYETLDEAVRLLFSQFSDAVCELENCMKYEQTSAFAFKYKKTLLAKASVRRDKIVIYFPLVNYEIKRQMGEGKSENVKVKPIEVILKSERDLRFAIQMVNTAIGNLKRAETERLEKRRSQRRVVQPTERRATL